MAARTTSVAKLRDAPLRDAPQPEPGNGAGLRWQPPISRPPLRSFGGMASRPTSCKLPRNLRVQKEGPGNMNLNFWLIQAFNGVSYGALLFLLGAGLSLIFGVMRIVN